MPNSHNQRFFLPGFSQTPAVWGTVVAGVEDAYVLDIPRADGWGDTIEALAGRSGVWAGYSLGGRLALQLAVSRPHQVTGLVLVSASPGIADAAERADRYQSDLELADWIESHTVEDFLDRWLSQAGFVGRTRDHRLADSHHIAHQLRTLSQGAQPSLWEDLESLSMPVAVVAGASDGKYVDIARRMVSLIGPNARLHLIPDCGHALLEEAPVAIRSLLL